MKMINNLFPISKTGFKYIVIMLALLIVFSIFDLEFLVFISFVIMLTLVYLFRNPEREVPAFSTGSLVSPSDGLVTSIEEISDKDYAYKIEVENSFSGVGVLRTPMDAKVESLKVVKGTRVSKNHNLFNCTNEYAEVKFSDNSSNSIKVIHKLQESFAPISLDIIEAQNLRQSTRYGNALNSVTTIYIPQNFRLNISVGNELKASESLIGYFS